MLLILQILLCVLALPATLASMYLLICTLLSWRLPQPVPSSRRLRFDIVIPAHNEAASIARTLRSLHQIDWPAEQYRLLVVADNCSDATAQIALAEGAEVIERCDAQLRGKGYALHYAFETSLRQACAEAVVVIDADAMVTPNLMEALATRIENGADAIQVHYGTLNPWDSWRTRLITIAKSAFHRVRSRARERLGLSCGIRGNGWCVTHRLLRAMPYQAFSLTEDVEYGIELGLAGYRVHYADEASANAEMVSSERTARSQRERWEAGRYQLILQKTPRLLASAVRRRCAICLDLALDLLVLPLSYVALNILVLILASGLATLWNAALQHWFWLALSCGLVLLLHVLRGWQLSGLGRQGLIDLARAPFYLVWKLMLMLRRQQSQVWVRTEREPP